MTLPPLSRPPEVFNCTLPPSAYLTMLLREADSDKFMYPLRNDIYVQQVCCFVLYGTDAAQFSSAPVQSNRRSTRCLAHN